MTAKLQIQDGSPVWLSPSVIPSKDTVVSPSSSPNIVNDIDPAATDVFVYVRVKNTGTVDLGTCACSAVGPWVAPTFFAGFLASTTASPPPTTVGGVNFSATPLGDSLIGPGIAQNWGFPGSGRRAWAFSPDGSFFAYASSPNGADWGLNIIALKALTREDGTSIAKNAVVATANGVFAGLWTANAFGWAGSRAVVVSGLSAVVGTAGLSIVCPYAPAGGNSYGALLLLQSGALDWSYLVSPCGEAIAITPKKLSSVGMGSFSFVATGTAKLQQFKKNNAPQGITSTGPNPSITTNAHTASGVTINTGSGATVTVDDPDCTFIGSAVTARVDRVKASTLPSANLGVIAVGVGSIGALKVNDSFWVQVPNTHGWANQSESHWCLLAQAYTADLVAVPPSWNGQAASPPPFPVAMDDCAQRNVAIG